MKTEEELLIEVEAECPALDHIEEVIGAEGVYLRRELGRYLMAKQQARLVNEGALQNQVEELTAAVSAREATICRLESVVQTVAGCIEGPDTCDGEGVTRISMPRRVVDLVVEIDTKVTVVDVERVFREGGSYVPLADYYRREPPLKVLKVSSREDRITAEMMNSILKAPGRPSRASFGGVIGVGVGVLGSASGVMKNLGSLRTPTSLPVSMKTARKLLGMKDDEDVGDV